MLDGDLLAGVLRLPPAEAAPLLMAAAALLRAGLQQYGVPPAPQAAAAAGAPLSPEAYGAAQEAWLLQIAAAGATSDCRGLMAWNGEPSGPSRAAGEMHAQGAFAAVFQRAAAGLEQAWRPGSGVGAPAEDTWPMRLRMLVERVLSRFV